MRERLVAAFVGVGVLVMAIFTVFRAYTVGDLVESQEARKIERSADLLAVLVEERASAGRPITPVFLSGLLNTAERIEYVDASGERASAAAPDYESDAGIADIVESRLVSLGGRVTLSRSGDLVQERVANAILPLVLLGLALLAVAAAVGYLAAIRLARPFQDLASRAGEFGRERFDPEIPRYGVPEADAIGRALSRAARAVTTRMQREREFAANASHQLRTPLTALRLQLEDISLWRETPAEVRAELSRALGEVDRLSGTVDDLLALSRGGRLASPELIDATPVVRDTARRWQSVAETAGRRLDVAEADPVPVHVGPGPIAQVLDVLIDNALKHGAGDVTVEIAEQPTHVEIRVGDEGGRTIGNEIFARRMGSSAAGEGIGLTVASEIAEAVGGHLRLDDAATTTFALLLPRPKVPAGAGELADVMDATTHQP